MLVEEWGGYNRMTQMLFGVKFEFWIFVKVPMKKDECHEFQGNFSSGVIDVGDQKRLLFKGVLNLFFFGWHFWGSPNQTVSWGVAAVFQAWADGESTTHTEKRWIIACRATEVMGEKISEDMRRCFGFYIMNVYLETHFANLESPCLADWRMFSRECVWRDLFSIQGGQLRSHS